MTMRRCIIKFQITFLLAMFLVACSSGDVSSESPKTPPTGNITVSKSGDTATPQNPAKSEAGSPATVTLSQKASYDDPDGSVYTCEPKAIVTLNTSEQQVKAKSLAELTTIQQNISQTQQGQNPVTHQTTQTFTLGGQKLTFDLSHQVYTYTTSTKQQVEMPYLKLSAAKNGEAKAETRSASNAEIAVTGITLVPIATRGSYTTEQAYEVHVSFTVDATAMNATTPQSQTLCFEASYNAIVETTTEYADPQATFSYTLYTQGTASTKSPFTMKDKTQQMTVGWDQVAQYTYFSLDELATKVVTREPKAKVTLTIEQDTINAEDVEALKKVTTAESQLSTSGSDPAVTTGKQVFDIGGQKLTLDYSYEACPYVTVEGTEVPMPYLMFEAPEVVEVKVTETSQASAAKRHLAGKEYTIPEGQTRADASSDISNFQGNTVYLEVSARIRQSLKGVNTPETVSETVEYIVKYTAAIESKLISTTYEKDYVWYESHDNMPLMVCYQIHRIRTYSTGEKETDTFTCPYGKMVSLTHMMDNWRGSYDDCEYTYWDGTRVFYHKEISASQNDDYTNIFYYKTGISNFDSFSWKVRSDKDTWSDREDLSKYIGDLSSAHYNPDNPQEGWYALVIQRGRSVASYYHGSKLRGYSIVISYSDRLLYLDNQIIDFAEYRATHEFDFREENTTLTDGTPAKVFTHDCKTKYLGKEFYSALVDTVYQLK